jgi:hypothetical protein
MQSDSIAGRPIRNFRGALSKNRSTRENHKTGVMKQPLKAFHDRFCAERFAVPEKHVNANSGATARLSASVGSNHADRGDVVVRGLPGSAQPYWGDMCLSTMTEESSA